jgi:predicted aldo/keto reductase-like oxidoreductase
MSTRNVVLVTLILGLVVGFFLTGPYLWRTVEGVDPSGFVLGPQAHALADGLFGPLPNGVGGLVVGVGALLLIGGCGFFFARGAARRKVDASRRSFLTGAASGAGAGVGALLLGGGAAALRVGFGVGEGGRGWGNVTGAALAPDVPMTHPVVKAQWEGSRVQSYRRLGRTEAIVSDICVGAGPVSGEKGEKIVRAALDRGVTYVDTAPDYSANGSEHAIGNVIKGRRDELFLATKFCTPIGHLPAQAPVSAYMEAIESSLGRLGTDHVDLIHIHSCDTVERLMSENCHEAFDRLKEQGKARFLGFSSHTPNLQNVANAAIDSGRFDVMMPAYHFGAWTDLSDIIARAKSEQDMGVVAMKTLKGAKHRGLEDFEPYADAYSQAAFKWVLSNPDVSCLVISFREMQHVDEYLYASGGTFSRSDEATLREYDLRIAGTYCAPHCNACEGSCPEELPIADILRYRMYAEDYGFEKEGLSRYAALGKNAEVCASCSAPCTGACPLGLQIQERMRGAHDILSLS